MASVPLTRRVLAVALAATLSGTPSLFAQAAQELRIPDGTKISVRLSEALSSATSKSGDVVTFEVVEDVLVDNQVVIKQGTPARGTIVEAAEKRRMGRAGRLAYALTETKALDRQTIRLRANQERKGDSHVTSTAVTTTAVAVFVPVAAPFFLLRKGKDVTVAQGTRVEGFVDGDHVVSQQSSDETTAATPTSAPRGAQMGNADVLSLLQAGLGEDVVIAKIRTAVPAFSLETNDLTELKKAEVPERVH